VPVICLDIQDYEGEEAEDFEGLASQRLPHSALHVSHAKHLTLCCLADRDLPVAIARHVGSG
jgi:hypothetical protein